MATPSALRLSKFLGLRAGISPERMTLGDLVSAINVRIDETERLARRPGRSVLAGQPAHSLWSDGDVTLGVVDGMLSRIAPDYALTPLVAGITAPVSYARIDRRVYWSDGARSGVIELMTNVARSWGLAPPDSFSVTPTAGALPAGRYQYALVYLRSDGQESGALASTVIDLPADSGLVVTVSASPDPDVLGAMLYLSTPGGSTLYRALTIAPAGGTRTYSGDASELRAPLRTQFMQPPPASRVLAAFAGRMWVAFDDYLLPSESFAPELFDLRKHVPVLGTVTMLAPLDSKAGMFVGTSDGCGFLRGQDPKEMSWEAGPSDPVLPGAITSVPGRFFGDGALDGEDIPVWAGERALYAGLPDGHVRTLTLARAPLSLAGRAALAFDPDLKTVLLSTSA